jgi:hypothetical protein
MLQIVIFWELVWAILPGHNIKASYPVCEGEEIEGSLQRCVNYFPLIQHSSTQALKKENDISFPTSWPEYL